MVFRAPWPSLSPNDSILIALSAQPVKHVGGISSGVMTSKIGSVKIEVRFDNPVSCRRCRAPVVVFEVVANGADTAGAAAVPDRIDG